VHDYGFRKIQLIPFLCRIEKGEISILEHADFKWLKFEDFNKIDLVEADKKVIKENEKELKKHAREKMNNS
jgi:8-oxo-dGTP diphosphatase